MLATLRARLFDALGDPRASRVIIGVGFAIRLIALALVAGMPLSGDGLSYHETAQHLAHGDVYEPHWPPGLPLFLSLVYRVDDHQIVGRTMMLVVYGVFCVLIADLGRRLEGVRAANIALAVFAVTPIFIWSSVTPLTQLFSATLALGVVAFADRCLQGGERLAKNATLLGLALTGLMLTRPSNIGIAIVVPLYVLWRTRRWATLVIPVVLMAVALGSWSAKAHAMTGRPVFVNDANSQNIYYGNNPWTPTYRTWWFGSRHREDGDPLPPGYEADLKEVEDQPFEKRDRAFVEKAVAHILDQPGLFVRRSFARVRTFAGFETYTSAQLVHKNKLLGELTLALDASLYLLIIGLAIFLPGARALASASESATWLAESRETIRLVLIVALLYALPYFAVFSHPTFHFTDVPLVGLLGAVVGARALEGGFSPLWRALTQKGRFAVAAGYVAFFLINAEWALDVLSRPAR